MRFILPIILSTFILLVGISTSFYFINPYEVESENIGERFLGGKPYRIPSKSMQDTLVPGDYIIVSRTAYRDQAPQRGDVVVFKGISKKSNKKTVFIKRVIAIAGDSVRIVRGRLLINDKIVKEPYVHTTNKMTSYSLTMDTRYVPTGKLFLLGDNRDKSNDSRLFGFITVTAVVGKATRLLYGRKARSGNEIK